ncbi:2604_t:CDS:2, partial [Funneliformis caledonium]
AEINAEGLDDDGQMSASDYEKFCQKYSSMKTSKKWLLSTGTAVEDKLYDFRLKCIRKHFIDKAFENLGDVEAVRDESFSLASSERKNKKRTVSALIKVKRKILSRKGDLIICKNSLKYGCSE